MQTSTFCSLNLTVKVPQWSWKLGQGHQNLISSSDHRVSKLYPCQFDKYRPTSWDIVHTRNCHADADANGIRIKSNIISLSPSQVAYNKGLVCLNQELPCGLKIRFYRLIPYLCICVFKMLMSVSVPSQTVFAFSHCLSIRLSVREVLVFP